MAAVKKNELYSSLWASCDELRGGMDASQYKDYILTLLFVRYVSDKFKGQKYADLKVPEKGSFYDIVALKGNKNIGEEIDKVIARLAEANNLRGVIDNAHFNDASKLGQGQELVDKLTKIIAIFERPEFDLKNNHADGDDIIGDAYEYLMRHFATESGKSKGQFYTPAEVSRILAKVIGVDKITSRDTTVYDPACGSGSLLIKVAEAAPFEISMYGQEKDVSTAGLAKMNFVLHNKAASEVKIGSTFSDPQYFEPNTDDTILRGFDFVVANPPFSTKNWTNGFKGKEYDRFIGYDDTPPEKNGDYAWLLHILKSLKSKGKAAVILPHGVLFRGNAEVTIRKNIIDRGYIKGIIGLPANLFYGTGIPACVLVIDKKDANKRTGIFMIDASRDYIKDGNKNRLRERDIYKIVTTFNKQIEEDKYSRFVPNDEIKIKNEYNLNLPRYIDGSTPDDLQDIDAHLHGGIPVFDVDSMDKYWKLFGNLKYVLFGKFRKGYYKLNVPKDNIRQIIYADKEFSKYANLIDEACERWQKVADKRLYYIDDEVEIKKLIVVLAEDLIKKFENIELIDKYDVYEVLLSYWQDVMADDVYLVSQYGYEVGKEIYLVDKDWDGRLIPKHIIIDNFFAPEKTILDDTEHHISEAQSKLDEFIEEHTGEDGALFEYFNKDKDSMDNKAIKAEVKKLKKENNDDAKILFEYVEQLDLLKEKEKLLKEIKNGLDSEVKNKYPTLSIDEIKKLLIVKKWYDKIFKEIENLYTTVSHNIADRIVEIVERYESTLGELESDVKKYENKVKGHLKKMGFEL